MSFFGIFNTVNVQLSMIGCSITIVTATVKACFNPDVNPSSTEFNWGEHRVYNDHRAYSEHRVQATLLDVAWSCLAVGLSPQQTRKLCFLVLCPALFYFT